MSSKAWCIAREFTTKTEGPEGEQAAANLKELLCERFKEYSLPMDLSPSTVATRTSVWVKKVERGLCYQTVRIHKNGKIQTYKAKQAKWLTLVKAGLAKIPEAYRRYRMDEIDERIRAIDALSKRQMQRLPDPRVTRAED